MPGPHRQSEACAEPKSDHLIPRNQGGPKNTFNLYLSFNSPEVENSDCYSKSSLAHWWMSTPPTTHTWPAETCGRGHSAPPVPQPSWALDAVIFTHDQVTSLCLSFPIYKMGLLVGWRVRKLSTHWMNGLTFLSLSVLSLSYFVLLAHNPEWACVWSQVPPITVQEAQWSHQVILLVLWTDTSSHILKDGPTNIFYATLAPIVRLRRFPSVPNMLNGFCPGKCWTSVRYKFCVFWEDHVIFILVRELHCYYYYYYITQSIVTLMDFRVLNQPCILGNNSHLTVVCIVPLICCLSCFAGAEVLEPGIVAHACNPSYLGDWEQEDRG
jgi:hypothetical protein